jgi:hypothetical protein
MVSLTVGLYIVCIFNDTSRALASDGKVTNNIKEECFILPSETIRTHQKRAGKQHYRTCFLRRATAKPKNGNFRDWQESDDTSGQ